MSNRLTFSLASLILIFAFVAIPVMAHDDITGDTNFADHASAGHMHPTITVMVEDVDPTTDGIQVVRKATSGAITDLMITFDVTLELDGMVSLVNASDGAAIAAGSFNADSITTIVYNDRNGAVNSGDASNTAATAAAGATYTGSGLEWMTTVTVTLADDGDADTTDAEQRAAVLANGINVDLTAVENLVRANVIRGDYFNSEPNTPVGHVNVASEIVMVEVVAMAYEEPDLTAPAMPMNLMADAGNGQVTLTWDTVDDATAYEYSKDGGIFWAMIPEAELMMSDDGMSSYTVMGLTNGTAYEFQVRASNATGRSAASASASASPEGPRTEYGATAMYDADTMTTSLSGIIASKGFVVVEAAALPDLQEFFDIGGTIGVDDGDPAEDNNSRTVVISEILWGLDFGATLIADQKQWQFIELYNTTADAINLEGWMLKFTHGRPVPKSDIDQVSNRSGTGWVVDIGQSGRVTGTRAVDQRETITAINIVSMYRNINYGHAHVGTNNRSKLGDWIPSGNDKSKWEPSKRRDPNTPNGVGVTGAQAARWIYSTRGDQHYTTTAILTPSSVAGTPFRINEIGNNEGSENDWVELHNVSDAAQSLRNYQLTKVTAQDTDTELFDFVGEAWDNRKIPAGGYLVISTRHPRDTDLAGGNNIEVADTDELNKGAKHLFRVTPEDTPVDLPDDGKFTLILRGGHGDAHKSEGRSDRLIDVVATRNGSFAHANTGTSLWPLTATGLPHGNVIDGTDGGAKDETFKAGFVYQRDKGNGRGEKHFKVRVYTGIGYDRGAAAVPSNGGTPGYDNGALKDKIGGLTEGEITISEVMVDAGEGRQNLAQWIELYNSSMTQAVNLAGWKLHIENAANGDGELETNTFSATLTLGSKTISPNQTVLIATTTGLTSDPGHFPSTRVINLWTTPAHRNALEMVRRTDPVLSSVGFNITLADKDNVEVDAVGNLDGISRTRDEPAWPLPMSEDDGRRSSLLRIYDEGVAVDGMMEEAWVSADATSLAWAISHTYYGNPDDFGTPGFRAGGPLPVQLSKFRPERLDDGSIVVRWITESELDNAGFNILRSETRDGEFTKLNAQLIEGQGTTSERNTYDFVDTTAKPNVVYYYQIQDVSLDGKVQTLRQSRLKGHVSPAGKLTTVWGELKALQ